MVIIFLGGGYFILLQNATLFFRLYYKGFQGFQKKCTTVKWTYRHEIVSSSAAHCSQKWIWSIGINYCLVTITIKIRFCLFCGFRFVIKIDRKWPYLHNLRSVVTARNYSSASSIYWEKDSFSKSALMQGANLYLFSKKLIFTKVQIERQPITTTLNSKRFKSVKLLLFDYKPTQI